MTKLKLEAGKYYLTRDGRKVGPMRVHRDGDCMKSEGEKETGLWNFDGSPFFSFAYDSPQLIAIWTDTPTLKVGDKVKVVAGYGTLFNGRTGIVTHVEGNDAYVASKSNLPTDCHEGGDFHLYFWGSELEPIPTIGTIYDLNIGDTIEWIGYEFLGELKLEYIHGKDHVFVDFNGSPYTFSDGDGRHFRIISRASDAKSPVELSVDLGEAIKQVVAESQSGPVQLRKVIVPGVYGRVEVSDIYGLSVSAINMVTRDDLTAAIATLTAIRDAL